MRTSDRGIIAIIGYEGIVPGPYLDTATPPVWTWGVGHTAAAGSPKPAAMPRGMPADLDAAIAEALRVFAVDLGRYESAVRTALTVPVAQHQFDALVSWHYNTGAVARASLTKRINAGDLAGAAVAFMDWRRPASIITRRRAEQSLFRNGIYPETSLTVWRVSPDGRVIFRPARTLMPAEALVMMGSAAGGHGR